MANVKPIRSPLVKLTGMSTTAALCPKCQRGHSGGGGKSFPHRRTMMLHNKYLRNPEVIVLECPCCGYTEAMNMTPINYKLNTAEHVLDKIMTRYTRLTDLSKKITRRPTGPVDPTTGVPMPQPRRI